MGWRKFQARPVRRSTTSTSSAGGRVAGGGRQRNSLARHVGRVQIVSQMIRTPRCAPQSSLPAGQVRPDLLLDFRRRAVTETELSDTQGPIFAPGAGASWIMQFDYGTLAAADVADAARDSALKFGPAQSALYRIDPPAIMPPGPSNKGSHRAKRCADRRESGCRFANDWPARSRRTFTKAIRPRAVSATSDPQLGTASRPRSRPTSATVKAGDSTLSKRSQPRRPRGSISAVSNPVEARLGADRRQAASCPESPDVMAVGRSTRIHCFTNHSPATAAIARRASTNLPARRACLSIGGQDGRRADGFPGSKMTAIPTAI